MAALAHEQASRKANTQESTAAAFVEVQKAYAEATHANALCLGDDRGAEENANVNGWRALSNRTFSPTYNRPPSPPTVSEVDLMAQ